MATTPKQILYALQQSILRHFNLSNTQVDVAVAKVDTPTITWHENQPYILITPGGAQPYGGGNGTQDGGGLVRVLSPTITIYTRNKKDQHKESNIAILDSNSVLDWSENLIQLFRETYLGQNPYAFLNGLLMEPIYFQGSSAPDWEDQKLGIIFQETTFSCVFETQPVNIVSLTTPTSNEVSV